MSSVVSLIRREGREKLGVRIEHITARLLVNRTGFAGGRLV